MKQLLLALCLACLWLACTTPAPENAYAQPTPPLLLTAIEGSSPNASFLFEGQPWAMQTPWGLEEYVRLAWESPAAVGGICIRASENMQFDVYGNGALLGRVASNDTLLVKQALAGITIHVAPNPLMPLVWATESANKPGMRFLLEKKQLSIDKLQLFDPQLQPFQIKPKEEKIAQLQEGAWVNRPIFYRTDQDTSFLILRANGSFCAYLAKPSSTLRYEGSWTRQGEHRFSLKGYETQGKSLSLSRQASNRRNTLEETVTMQGLLRSKNLPAIYTQIPDSAFVELVTLADFVIDMKYATSDNFVKEPMYDCGRCLLRYEAAKALLSAHTQAKKHGYRIKVFDGYRPLHIQKRMWDAFPNPTYVANPYSGIGSIHNRGGAVDMTLIDANGQELNMGTPYDFFGKAAHQDYFDLPEEVLKNRELLRTIMQNAGFMAIRTEWWHYSYQNKTKFTVSDVPLPCEVQ
jgi:D-alanyl-D-alanine dipeptidase